MKTILTLCLMLLAFAATAQTNTIISGRIMTTGLSTNICGPYITYWTYTNHAGKTYFSSNVTNGGTMTFSCNKTNPVYCAWVCIESFRAGCNANAVSIIRQSGETNYLLSCYCPYFFLAKPPIAATIVNFNP